MVTGKSRLQKKLKMWSYNLGILKTSQCGCAFIDINSRRVLEVTGPMRRTLSVRNVMVCRHSMAGSTLALWHCWPQHLIGSS